MLAIAVFASAANCRLLSAVSFGAIGEGASDWEWTGGGGVQELGGEPDEADGSVLTSAAGEQNVAHLFAPLRRSMEMLLEYLHIILNAPSDTRKISCLLTFFFNR